MKFYNHNHHCYIMGEGTFAGKQCKNYPVDDGDVIIKDGKNLYACMTLVFVLVLKHTIVV